jgi:hypothetical protein
VKTTTTTFILTGDILTLSTGHNICSELDIASQQEFSLSK